MLCLCISLKMFFNYSDLIDDWLSIIEALDYWAGLIPVGRLTYIDS